MFTPIDFLRLPQSPWSRRNDDDNYRWYLCSFSGPYETVCNFGKFWNYPAALRLYNSTNEFGWIRVRKLDSSNIARFEWGRRSLEEWLADDRYSNYRNYQRANESIIILGGVAFRRTPAGLLFPGIITPWIAFSRCWNACSTCTAHPVDPRGYVIFRGKFIRSLTQVYFCRPARTREYYSSFRVSPLTRVQILLVSTKRLYPSPLLMRKSTFVFSQEQLHARRATATSGFAEFPGNARRRRGISRGNYARKFAIFRRIVDKYLSPEARNRGGGTTPVATCSKF